MCASFFMVMVRDVNLLTIQMVFILHNSHCDEENKYRMLSLMSIT